MLDVLTADDVRRQDAACLQHGIATETLMERAGFAVARAVRGMLGYTYGLRVVVVCGKGNNAGDGLVAARWLAAWGAHVTVIEVLGSDFAGAAREARRRFRGRVAGINGLERELDRADLAIDALLGIGLSRAPAGDAARAIESLNTAGVPVVSIDVPSGMDADTGGAPGVVVAPSGVVTLSGLKPGLLFSPGGAWIEVADIGIPPDLRGGVARSLSAADVAGLLPIRARDGHKRSAGTVMVVAGSRAMPGAAALTAGASVHAGAGLTTLAATERVTAIALTRVPEMTTIVLPDSPEGSLDDKGAEAILDRAGEFSMLAIGPGLSRHPATIDAVRRIAAGAPVPVVLDADAISAFAGDAAALRSRSALTVMTPHEGEAARLLGWDSSRVRADRLAAAERAASETGAIVLLKGPGTIVREPGAATYLNTTGNQGLAQGGTGDVLTGIVAALLAQAPDGPPAAVVAAAAWLHGRAADIAAERCAPHPSNASMLIDMLPEAIHGVFR